MVVTAAALGLVAFAFQSGLHLVTEDLPPRHVRGPLARADRRQPRLSAPKVTRDPPTTTAASVQAATGERRASRSRAR